MVFYVQAVVSAGAATVLHFGGRFRRGNGGVGFLGSGHDGEVLHLFESVYVYKHVLQ